MDLHDGSGSAARFRSYAADLASVLGHADRVRPFGDYCIGLLVAEGRKSVEPLAAVTAPERTAAQHQSLLHIVAQAPWSDAALLRRVRERVLASLTREEPIQAWIIDDTSFPKKGTHSVGVGRQYCGQLGKQENCQVAVSLSVATHQASLPIGYRLYLPQDWAEDPARRAKTGVPEDVVFRTKPEIALAQMRQALADGVPAGVALMDPAYGNNGPLRAGMTALGLSYAVGIMPNTNVQRATHRRRNAAPAPLSAKALAQGLAAKEWHKITWREGSNAPLASRFARIRVRPAGNRAQRHPAAAEEWLLIEWPEGATEPDHYWLSTLPPDIDFARMVDLTKLRWRIERDYLELKQEVGLGHYEGRGWRGLHHHASLCIAAYGFLISERETIPPSGPARPWRRPQFAVPDGCRPRGSASSYPTPHAPFDRHPPSPPRPGHRPRLTAMSMLRTSEGTRRSVE